MGEDSPISPRSHEADSSDEHADAPVRPGRSRLPEVLVRVRQPVRRRVDRHEGGRFGQEHALAHAPASSELRVITMIGYFLLRSVLSEKIRQMYGELSFQSFPIEGLILNDGGLWKLDSRSFTVLLRPLCRCFHFVCPRYSSCFPVFTATNVADQQLMASGRE